MFFNFIISNFFLKLGYFIITPRNYSFGAFYGTLINGSKIANYLAKKKIICISFIDYHNKFGKKKIYNFKLTLRTINQLKIDEIILSFLLTFLLLPFQLIYFTKFSSLFNRVLGKDFSYKIIPKYFGYGENYITESLQNKYNFVHQLKLSPELFSTNKVRLFNNSSNSKEIALCIKDENYNSFKEISNIFCSDIEFTRETINYLIKEGFKIKRIGEPMMKKFNYNDVNYYDLTKSKDYLDHFNLAMKNSDFYIGSGASQGEAVELFDKKKCIINSIDHLASSFSCSKKNTILFKKIFDVKKKKFLSIEEIFEMDLFDNNTVNKKYKNKEIMLIENNSSEILDSVKFFLESNKNNYFDDSTNKTYFSLRKYAVEKKLKEKKCSLSLSAEFHDYRVPINYLNRYLFRSKYLDEISYKFYKENF